jgi:hypothetical protein
MVLSHNGMVVHVTDMDQVTLVEAVEAVAEMLAVVLT